MLNKLKLVEVKSENGKDYFIEGFVSTTNADDYNDIVTEKAQMSLNNQLQTFNITMDLEHEEWIDPVSGERHLRKQDKIPVALVKESSVTEEGTFVKALLNDAHPLFENILRSIKKGFLHSFSIAYDVVAKTIKQVGEDTYRFIEDLTISNIGITGNPVNKEATFKIALKSISKKMEENNKIVELETKITEMKSHFESEITELKNKYKANEDKLSEKEKEDADKKDDDMKKKDEKEVKSMSELKSLNEKVESQTKEISELKSTLEKLRATPINGAQLKSQTENKVISEVNFRSLL